jgi:Na+/H+ antiporter NhaC
MHEIMVLSLLIGGLSGFMWVGMQKIVQKFLSATHHRTISMRSAQYIIAGIVSLFDLLLANNTIAILFSGEIARNIAQIYKIPPHRSAVWLDTFSCVFQGIIPYGAQILLVSSITEVSPLAVTGQVYYCYVLGVVALGYIAFSHK